MAFCLAVWSLRSCKLCQFRRNTVLRHDCRGCGIAIYVECLKVNLLQYIFLSGQDTEKQRYLEVNLLASWTWWINRKTWRTNRRCRRPFSLEKCKWPPSVHASLRAAEPSESPLKRLSSRSSFIQLTSPNGVSGRTPGGLSGRQDDRNSSSIVNGLGYKQRRKVTWRHNRMLLQWLQIRRKTWN